MLRSATRFRALDETALFGSACRHEFPAVFLNLKHGERYILTRKAQMNDLHIIIIYIYNITGPWRG